ncbi:MAG: YggT family protein [Desulfarculaceae bacterium]|nr:YggT family protein [Desulfarculaceae bacterium]MCF8073992.1 YggT family protein [Desulfarculaceae bacterium]MCF8102678.1 YggT family protein [Desulfarculaceae bacterium]MCF8116081.1 YggT family protein [Desulfarculaceae bacterium]
MIFMVKILQFISWILGAYMWIIIAAAVITWVRPDPNNPIVRFLFAVTEPVFWRIRRIIPTSFGGFDVAPVILILAIIFIQNVVISGLMGVLIGNAMAVR